VTQYNIGGLVSVGFFYLIILGVGIWSGWKRNKKTVNDTENIILAGRDIGLFIGVLTMTATWVAGAYINGTTEGAFTGGFLKCSPMPIGYSISLLIGGKFFAKPMREGGYTTMLDPFQQKYGPRVGGLLFLPALFGEIFWSGAILSALGSIFTVMLGMDNTLAIVISATVAVSYTLFGGLYSVAYTDVIQLLCVVFGLVLCIPFVWTNEAINYETLSNLDWVGKVETIEIGAYIDFYCLVILGGIPWQVYFQRVLSCRTSRQAQVLSYAASVGCVLLAVPPAILGTLGKAADWNSTALGRSIEPSEYKSILPMILQYLTPTWVSYIGMGAVSAAFMSSADSCVLSTSSMFVHNIYKTCLFPNASEKHIVRVMWLSIIVAALCGTVMALKVNTIFGLSYLCADVIYVALFPQLLLVIYGGDYTNTYGSFTSFVLGFMLRILSGEKLLYIPAMIEFPLYDSVEEKQMFPFRTFIMVVSLLLQVSVSVMAQFLFTNGYFPSQWDIFQCFSDELMAIKENGDLAANGDDEEDTAFLENSTKPPIHP